jgi:signal transduction histidine kinase
LGAIDSQQLTKKLHESQTLLEISQMLAGTIDLDIILQQIADAATALIKSASRTILHLLDDSGNYLQAVAVSGPDRPKVRTRLNFKLGEGIAGTVLECCQTINVPDVLEDARYVPVKMVIRDEAPIRSLLVAPVITDDKRLGTLSVNSPFSNVFTQDDERLLTTLGVQAAVAIGKARLYADLQAALQHEKDTRAQLVQAEKLAALGRIVASVAHELNNPLQAIQNALYLIDIEENLSQQAREDLQTVLTEANRMAELIARLRETYRPAVSEEFQLISINSIVLDVHKLLATHLRHNQIEFQFYPDENIPLVPVIKDQIKQVVLNICLNAIEAMQHGGQITVRSDNQWDGKSVTLSISDTGPSIKPEILPYIYDPFVTTKDGGTGLGLAITYDIVQRHQGKIEVESEPPSGTTFRISLPLTHHFDQDHQTALQWV